MTTWIDLHPAGAFLVTVSLLTLLAIGVDYLRERYQRRRFRVEGKQHAEIVTLESYARRRTGQPQAHAPIGSTASTDRAS